MGFYVSSLNMKINSISFFLSKIFCINAPSITPIPSEPIIEIIIEIFIINFFNLYATILIKRKFRTVFINISIGSVMLFKIVINFKN